MSQQMKVAATKWQHQAESEADRGAAQEPYASLQIGSVKADVTEDAEETWGSHSAVEAAEENERNEDLDNYNLDENRSSTVQE